METKAGFVQSIRTYFRESFEELKKVTWPTRKETLQKTLTVIIFSVGVALFLGALDILFSFLLQKVLTL